MGPMKCFVFLFLTGCGVDAFIPLIPDSMEPAEAGDSAVVDPPDGSDAATNDVMKADSGSIDAGDAGSDSPSCVMGLQACEDAISTYCARMKTCCNNGCSQSWQNNGGSECANHFVNTSCNGKTVCENTCLSDLQAASCPTIKSSFSPGSAASSCMNLW
jgi:hypothetical protein